MYQPAIGQAMCEECSPGTVQRRTGKTECIPCRTGRFQALPGQSLCVKCPAGKHFIIAMLPRFRLKTTQSYIRRSFCEQQLA